MRQKYETRVHPITGETLVPIEFTTKSGELRLIWPIMGGDGSGDDGDGGGDDGGDGGGDDGTGKNGDDDGTPEDEKDLPGHVKAILAKNRRDMRVAEKARKAAEKKAAEFEKANLTEAERTKQEAEEAKAEAARLRTENLRMRVGTKLNLPSALIDRIKGDTEEDMTADAKALQALVSKAPSKPTSDAGKSGGSGTPDMNTLLRAAAGH